MSKCRGCGGGYADTYVEGLGYMHAPCEISRLNGLLREARSLTEKYEAELRSLQSEREVDFAFYKLTVKQRDDAWKEIERLRERDRVARGYVEAWRSGAAEAFAHMKIKPEIYGLAVQWLEEDRG